MINGKKVLAIIPARGGSKGLPGKNIRDFCGIPLIGHAINIARGTKYIDKVVVSTDCEKIMSVSRSFESDIHVRSEHLSTDSSPVADTIREILLTSGIQYDYFVLLETTSPLRKVEQVEECLEHLSGHGLDSVATFSKAEPPPTRLWKLEGGMVKTYINGADPWLPRQMHDDAIYLNGMVYAAKVKSFLEINNSTIFFGKSFAIITEGPAVDIDTIDDFDLAEILMEKRNETF